MRYLTSARHAAAWNSGATTGHPGNIDITKTIGDVKGLQVYGSYDILSKVDAYENGDTGIQVLTQL